METFFNGPKPTMNYTDFLELPDSDNIRIKNIIKRKILDNGDILYLLNAAEAYSESEAYFGNYVLPYCIVDGANEVVHNYLCFETSFTEIPQSNAICKRFQIIFYICISKNEVIHPESGIARHDLISMLLERDFNWSEAFGIKCVLVQDKAGTTDLNYVTRTLVFELELPNGLSKTNLASGESFYCNSDPDEEW